MAKFSSAIYFEHLVIKMFSEFVLNQIEKFIRKKWIFSIIDCGYTLEPHHWIPTINVLVKK